MNIALWITQSFLALVFLGSAYFKGTRDREGLVASGQTGVQGFSIPLIRFIAVSELLGALGLLLPGIFSAGQVLVPLAAIGLAIIMVLAAVVHARLNEPRNVATNIFLLILCVFVAWGRWPSPQGAL